MRALVSIAIPALFDCRFCVSLPFAVMKELKYFEQSFRLLRCVERLYRVSSSLEQALREIFECVFMWF